MPSLSNLKIRDWSYGRDVVANGPLYKDTQKFLLGTRKICDSPEQPFHVYLMDAGNHLINTIFQACSGCWKAHGQSRDPPLSPMWNFTVYVLSTDLIPLYFLSFSLHPPFLNLPHNNAL